MQATNVATVTGVTVVHLEQLFWDQNLVNEADAALSDELGDDLLEWNSVCEYFCYVWPNYSIAYVYFHWRRCSARRPF